MAEKSKKPKFLRQDRHKMLKLGKKLKKKMKWRTAKGRHSKIRLNRKGHARRPKIGWSIGKIRERIVKIENLKQFEGLKQGQKIIISKIGKMKKRQIIKKANEMKLKILNQYKKLDDYKEKPGEEKKNATS